MPGKRSTETVISDYLSEPSLYRTITTSDSDTSFTQTIDFRYQVKATANTIVIIPVLTSGTGTIKFDLYVNFPNAASSVPTKWFLHVSTDAVNDSKLIVVNDLFAGVYKLKATTTGSAAFAVHTMSTDLPTQMF